MDSEIEAAPLEHRQKNYSARCVLFRTVARFLSRFAAMFLYEVDFPPIFPEIDQSKLQVAFDYQGVVIVRHKEVHREQISGPGVIPYNVFIDQRYRYDLRVASTVILANEPMITRDKLEVAVTISQCGNFQNLSEATRYSVNSRYGRSQEMPGKELLAAAKKIVSLYTLKELFLKHQLVEAHMQSELSGLFLREGYNLQRLYLYVVASDQLERFLAAPTIALYNARAEKAAANADLRVLKSLSDGLRKKTYRMRYCLSCASTDCACHK
ncbi:Mechanosensory protein 2 [Trichuris trichiura]|uniref:Mechanosensory protein 2 n=1 Tax=Trichuris trichiura TaxID=36087 RepID=A0A077Z7N8_TRITR|nr:Mechanosensory protein 2 [Trichuris trichiura]